MFLLTMLAPFAAVGALLLIIIPVALYYAWAASYLWDWFIVPTFGAPQLSVLQIWGICLTLGVLRPRLDLQKRNHDGWESGIFTLVFAPLVALGLGYAIKFWWM